MWISTANGGAVNAGCLRSIVVEENRQVFGHYRVVVVDNKENVFAVTRWTTKAECEQKVIWLMDTLNTTIEDQGEY